jgi:NADP-reducing hydrogenase subunit HndB
MKTINELNAIKDKIRSELNIDKVENSNIRITVGLATCGIAAGAKEVFERLKDEVICRGLKNVSVKQVGCIGMCRLEPIVEVYVPGKQKVTYVKVTADKAAKIISDHVVNGNLVQELLVQKD